VISVGRFSVVVETSSAVCEVVIIASGTATDTKEVTRINKIDKEAMILRMNFSLSAFARISLQTGDKKMKESKMIW